MRRAALLLASGWMAVAGCAARPVSPPATAAAAEGYLSTARLDALADAVPPPPRAGTAAEAEDLAASERLRGLENGDRWLLATKHAELRPALALAHFECALGFRLSAAESPRLVEILDRVLHDGDAAAERAKARSFRPRPVGADLDRPACQVVSAAGRASPSYPSGSATVGVAYGRVLATLVPDEAEALERSGHEIAISRMICGMHYPADVSAGEALGAAVADAVVATPTFERDAPAARAELARARASGLTSPACASERAALATPLP